VYVQAALQRLVLFDHFHQYLGLPPGFAADAAVFAFGDELLDLPLENVCKLYVWLTPGGCSFAAAYLLPRAEAALLGELQRLASAVTAAGQ
jgi:hypothetical protein